MNLEQFAARIFKKAPSEEMFSKQQLADIEKFYQHGRALKAMLRTPGWKVLKDYFKLNEKYLTESFKVLDTNDKAENVKFKVMNIQNQLNYQRRLLQYIDNAANFEDPNVDPNIDNQ